MRRRKEQEVKSGTDIVDDRSEINDSILDEGHNGQDDMLDGGLFPNTI